MLKIIEIGENSIEWERDKKTGKWNCKFKLFCRDIFDGVALSDSIIDTLEEMLKEKNKGVNE